MEDAEMSRNQWIRGVFRGVLLVAALGIVSAKPAVARADFTWGVVTGADVSTLADFTWDIRNAAAARV